MRRICGRGQARFSAGWVEHLLTQVWIPSIAGLDDVLQRGAAVADLGCGRGLALIKLAQAYPESYFVGYDAFEPEIQHATQNARAAGVADRVRFQHLDASRGLPSQYDVITTFDVVHDAVDPPDSCAPFVKRSNPTGSTCAWRSTARTDSKTIWGRWVRCFTRSACFIV